MKVVINGCFGGFGLSPKAVKLYAEKKGMAIYTVKNIIKNDRLTNKYKYVDWDSDDIFINYITKELNDDGTMKDGSYFYDGDLERTDKTLIEVVEELGAEANGWAAKLKIVEIPDDVDWYIHDYDGLESIYEKHRSWD